MKRLPEYLKRPIIDTDKTRTVRRVLKQNCLSTVCENARCPNKNECYTKNTATFLIMGENCTRNCHYCNISCEKPLPLNHDEPKNIAKAVSELGLRYSVITSVTRDDLPDGGAEHFAQCVREIKKISEDIKVEILTPDFKGNKHSLNKIIEAAPDVFNHNIEVVESIFKQVRPQGDYIMSLEVLRYVKENSNISTKSGLMVGLGETFEQIYSTMLDLRRVNCDILTIGQYIQPSKKHCEVQKYYTLEEFKALEKMAADAGFTHFQIGPLVRSSYNAAEIC